MIRMSSHRSALNAMLCTGLAISCMSRGAEPMDVGFDLASSLPPSFVECLHGTDEPDAYVLAAWINQSLNGRPGGRGGRMAAYETLEVREIELYDLDNDPGETVNLAAEHLDVIATIESLAQSMRADLGDSLRNREGSGRRPVGVVD
jgi:hypothetical protein